MKIKRLDMESGPKEAQTGDWVSFSVPHRRHLISGELKAMRLAAARVPGVASAESHLAVHPRMHML
jgi:hypothetical protein